MDDRVGIMKTSTFLIIGAIITMISPNTALSQFSAQEISFLCAGGLSTRFDADDVNTSSTSDGIRIVDQGGRVTVMQGDRVIDTFEGATYIQYVECLKAMSKRSDNTPSIPKFKGEIYFTYGNSVKFMSFINNNIGKIVFLDLTMNYEFMPGNNYDIEAKCNPNNGIWDSGLVDKEIKLPLGPEESNVSEITCAETAFLFTGKEFKISSAGPGTHWFDLTGFYRVAFGAGRWPYIEISAVEASADMWARLAN